MIMIQTFILLMVMLCWTNGKQSCIKIGRILFLSKPCRNTKNIINCAIKNLGTKIVHSEKIKFAFNGDDYVKKGDTSKSQKKKEKTGTEA